MCVCVYVNKVFGLLVKKKGGSIFQPPLPPPLHPIIPTNLNALYYPPLPIKPPILPTPAVAYMMGGFDGENSYSDVWQVNLQTLQWTRSSTDLLEPLYFHAADVSEVCRYVSHMLSITDSSLHIGV